MMSTRQRGRGSKYTDDFKRKLVAESSADGVSVPMVARRGLKGRCATRNNFGQDGRVLPKDPLHSGRYKLNESLIAVQELLRGVCVKAS
jgi:transposase-like protein